MLMNKVNIKSLLSVLDPLAHMRLLISSLVCQTQVQLLPPHGMCPGDKQFVTLLLYLDKTLCICCQH